MDKSSTVNAIKKKSYSKPMVTQVKLTPSEIVLGCTKTLGEPGCGVPYSI
jgi:hypothetical protein